MTDLFVFFLGLNYPHVPYQAEEPYFSAIDRQKLKKRIDYSFTKDKSAIMQEIHRRMHNEELTEDDWNEIRATYLAMCMKVDESFGKLIKALKERVFMMIQQSSFYLTMVILRVIIP